LTASLPPCAVRRITFTILSPVGTWGADIQKLLCMKSSLSEASCAPTDQKCLCTDAKYTEALESCVVASCTIRQSLSELLTGHIKTKMLIFKLPKMSLPWHATLPYEIERKLFLMLESQVA
jgi:hypothetical protein